MTNELGNKYNILTVAPVGKIGGAVYAKPAIHRDWFGWKFLTDFVDKLAKYKQCVLSEIRLACTVMSVGGRVVQANGVVRPSVHIVVELARWSRFDAHVQWNSEQRHALAARKSVIVAAIKIIQRHSVLGSVADCIFKHEALCTLC